MPKPPFDKLAISPFIIGVCVAEREYTGKELGPFGLGATQIAEIEKRRQAMTSNQIEEFGEYCVVRCRLAYDGDSKWFLDCANSKTNAGRDQLYVWITHWLSGYLDAIPHLERMRAYQASNKVHPATCVCSGANLIPVYRDRVQWFCPDCEQFSSIAPHIWKIPADMLK